MDGSSKLRRWRCVAIGQEGVWRGWWSKPFGHDVRHPQIEALPSNRYDSRGASTNRSTTLRRSGNSSGNFELIAPTLPPLGRATHANRLPTPPLFSHFCIGGATYLPISKAPFLWRVFFFWPWPPWPRLVWVLLSEPPVACLSYHFCPSVCLHTCLSSFNLLRLVVCLSVCPFNCPVRISVSVPCLYLCPSVVVYLSTNLAPTSTTNERTNRCEKKTKETMQSENGETGFVLVFWFPWCPLLAFPFLSIPPLFFSDSDSGRDGARASDSDHCYRVQTRHVMRACTPRTQAGPTTDPT